MGGRGLLDFDYIEWDEPDDPRGNVRHIAAAGITADEVEDVLCSPDSVAGASNTTGRPTVSGETGSGKYITVVYERGQENRVAVVRPVTAYEVGPPS
jgi:hypothetical protein